MSRRAHQKTEEKSKMVRVLSQYGATREEVAQEVGVSPCTLDKYYKDELAEGRAKANVVIRKTLFDKATKERDTACLIFMCKTRLGMRETNRFEMAGGLKLRWEDEE